YRGTQRYVPTVPADEDALTRAIVALASDYGRSGYESVHARQTRSLRFCPAL
ncbi:hypothetical protein GGQ91_005616, partial [Methylobacterium fujisawaense]|nr:hypothetical protein [Methylobacterium fujisawaense]